MSVTWGELTGIVKKHEVRIAMLESVLEQLLQDKKKFVEDELAFVEQQLKTIAALRRSAIAPDSKD